MVIVPAEVIRSGTGSTRLYVRLLQEAEGTHRGSWPSVRPLQSSSRPLLQDGLPGGPSVPRGPSWHVWTKQLGPAEHRETVRAHIPCPHVVVPRSWQV